MFNGFGEGEIKEVEMDHVLWMISGFCGQRFLGDVISDHAHVPGLGVNLLRIHNVKKF